MIPVYIICRDRVTPLKELVSWLEKTGEADIHLIDNDSTYPQLLEYYSQYFLLLRYNQWVINLKGRE